MLSLSVRSKVYDRIIAVCVCCVLCVTIINTLRHVVGTQQC